jgi:2'-5' RNA ligase
MRAFIAIPLPQEIKTFLANIQNQLKTSGADVKWVAPDNIHLTLKFLGEKDDEKIKQVIVILEEIAKDKKQFTARLASLGAFPEIASPRVIWVGIDRGNENSKLIAAELEERIAAIGIPKEEKGFSSHITIARTKSSKSMDNLVKELNLYADKFGQEKAEFNVNQIVLYKSTLTPKGPIYQALKAVNLKTT